MIACRLGPVPRGGPAVLRAAAQVNDVAASRDLKSLIDAGLLVKQGENRGRLYTASEEILSIRRRTTEPRSLQHDPFAEAR